MQGARPEKGQRLVQDRFGLAGLLSPKRRAISAEKDGDRPGA